MKMGHAELVREGELDPNTAPALSLSDSVADFTGARPDYTREQALELGDVVPVLLMPCTCAGEVPFYKRCARCGYLAPLQVLA